MIRSVKRALTFTIGLIFAILALLVVPNEVFSWPDHTKWTIAIAILLLAITALRIYLGERPGRPRSIPIQLARKSANRRRPTRVRISELSEDERIRALIFAAEATESWFNFSSDKSATVRLTSTIASPAAFNGRITEHVDLGGHKMSMTTTRVIDVNSLAWPAEFSYVPILRVQKKTLVHALKLSSNDRRISSLPYWESQGATVAAVHSLYDLVIRRENEPNQEKDKWYDPNGLWARIVSLITSDSPVYVSDTEQVVSDLREEFESLPGADTRNHWYLALVGLIRSLADAYYIIAVVPKASVEKVLRLTTVRTIPRSDHCVGIEDRTRLALGLSVRDYIIGMNPASETPSYHLQGSFDEESYLYAVSPELMALSHERPMLTFDQKVRVRRPDIVSKGTLGMDFFHVYTRDLDGFAYAADDRQVDVAPAALVELRERPPGTLALVLLLSGFLLALVWIVGAIYGLVFKAPDPATGLIVAAGSPWPTILFSIPAIMSSWLVSRFTSGLWSKISFATVAMTTWVIANAAVAMTFSAARLVRASEGPQTLGPITIDHLTWTLLMISTAASFGCCFVMMTNKGIRYVRRLSLN